MAEAFGYDLDRDAGTQQQGGVGVAQVVEADAGREPDAAKDYLRSVGLVGPFCGTA